MTDPNDSSAEVPHADGNSFLGGQSHALSTNPVAEQVQDLQPGPSEPTHSGHLDPADPVDMAQHQEHAMDLGSVQPQGAPIGPDSSQSAATPGSVLATNAGQLTANTLDTAWRRMEIQGIAPSISRLGRTTGYPCPYRVAQPRCPASAPTPARLLTHLTDRHQFERKYYDAQWNPNGNPQNRRESNYILRSPNSALPWCAISTRCYQAFIHQADLDAHIADNSCRNLQYTLNFTEKAVLIYRAVILDTIPNPPPPPS